MKDKIITKVVQIIEQKKKASKSIQCFVVGISGPPKSGKTTFAKNLTEELKKQGFNTVEIPTEELQFPAKLRYLNKFSEAKNYVLNHFNLAVLTQKIIKPAKARSNVSITLPILNPILQIYDKRKTYFFSKKPIIIVEGSFLFQSKYRRSFNLRIILKTSQEESRKRFTGEETFYEFLWQAEKIYKRIDTPEEIVEIIIDNENFNEPKFLKVPNEN
ncbi:hypothetical protein IT568_00510 [bacterium]|nr:hypothetical protein [bacterium]